MARYNGNETDLLLPSTADTLSEVDDQAEFLSASEAVKKLEECWRNEMMSPELLPPKNDLVDCLLEQTRNMEENLATISKSDFRFALHRMEVERIQFVITSYLRIRLEKIERFLSYILSQENSRRQSRSSDLENLLTDEELVFARELSASTEQHLKTLGLKHMPSNMRDISKEAFMTMPNKDSFIFVKVKDDCPSVLVSDGAGEEEVELLKNTQHLLPYRSVASLLENGAVDLL